MKDQNPLKDLLPVLSSELENVWENVPKGYALPEHDKQELFEAVGAYTFDAPVELSQAVREVSEWLQRWTVHTTHPRYFGLFNPSVHAGSIAGDALAAVYNPQVGVWSHSPAANVIEQHVLRFFMDGYGYGPEAAGHFTTGGSEANLSAVAVALHHAFPELKQKGIRSLDGDPVMYISEETHHSFHKTVSVFGLGEETLRQVPVDQNRRLRPDLLAEMIHQDRRAGKKPFLVVGTAGTTTLGVVDPLKEIAEVAQEAGIWYHADAAWGGFAFLAPSLKGLLDGIHLADSITCDAHKGFSVSMGAGLFLTQKPEALTQTFGIDASYVTDLIAGDGPDTFNTSLQWSRRFIGLKVFMTLAELGAAGMGVMMDHQIDMGNKLRKMLAESGWEPVGESRLPLVCFTHPQLEGDRTKLREVLRKVYEGRQAWISEATAMGKPVFRACITSWKTEIGDLEFLIRELERARLETT